MKQSSFSRSDLNFVHLAFKGLKMDDYGCCNLETTNQYDDTIVCGVFQIIKFADEEIRPSILGNTVVPVSRYSISAMYVTVDNHGMSDCSEVDCGVVDTLSDAITLCYTETMKWGIGSVLEGAAYEAYKD